MGFKRPADVDWSSVAIHLMIRCRGRCEFCGDVLPSNHGVIHHRKLRSRGGGDELENLMVGHNDCHVFAHANPTLATEHGWMVPSEHDPAATPVVACRARTFNCLHTQSNG